jgi:hypothetical protein
LRRLKGRAKAAGTAFVLVADLLTGYFKAIYLDQNFQVVDAAEMNPTEKGRPLMVNPRLRHTLFGGT